MKSPWIELTFLFLGWFLGISAGPIQAWLSRIRDRSQLKRAVWTELSDLRERLALATFMIEGKRDGISRDLLSWIRKYIVLRNRSFPSAQLVEVAKHLSELSDNQFDSIKDFIQKDGASGLALKRYELRYLGSKLDRLELLPEATQEHLLAVLTHLDFINQHIEDSKFYRNLTFQNGISEKNYEIASIELLRGRDLVAKQARTLIEMIDYLEPEIKKG